MCTVIYGQVDHPCRAGGHKCIVPGHSGPTMLRQSKLKSRNPNMAKTHVAVNQLKSLLFKGELWSI